MKADAGAGEVAVGAPKTYRGTCLCGGVQYTAIDPSDIWYCHCKQCQHLTGLYIAAAGVRRENLTIEGDVNWLQISDRARSGHCASCGSYLFWDAHDFETVSLLAGNLLDTTGLEVKGHIFVSQKGGYYEIMDGLPQFDTYPPNGTRAHEVIPEREAGG